MFINHLNCMKPLQYILDTILLAVKLLIQKDNYYYNYEDEDDEVGKKQKYSVVVYSRIQ